MMRRLFVEVFSLAGPRVCAVRAAKQTARREHGRKFERGKTAREVTHRERVPREKVGGTFLGRDKNAPTTVHDSLLHTETLRTPLALLSDRVDRVAVRRTPATPLLARRLKRLRFPDRDRRIAECRAINE